MRPSRRWQDVVGMLIVALSFATAAAAQEGALETGVRQVREGDFEQALVTLDGVTRTLTSQGGAAPELARAHLYLGVAYVGLGQDALAQAKFRRALTLDRTLTLSAEEFPPKVLRSFEAV